MGPKKTATATKSSVEKTTAKRKVEKEKPDPVEDPEDDVPEKKTKPRAARKVKNAKEEEPKVEPEDTVPEKGKRGKAAASKKKSVEEEENGTVEKPSKSKKAQGDTAKAKKAPAAEKEKKVAAPRAKRGKKAETEEPQQAEEEAVADAKKERKRKAPAKKTEKAESESQDATEKKAPKLMNATATDWENINFKTTAKSPKGKSSNFHITSWNVDGLRAWLKKGGMNIIKYDAPDIFCIQESKCNVQKIPDEFETIEGYESFWCESDKEGYAGVGIFTKIPPLQTRFGIDSEEHDAEGRCITLEFEHFYLVNVYVPNAGRKLVTLPKRLEWNEAFKAHVKKLDKKKPVIICGDMNVAHEEIDLANPKTNTKNAGFTAEEREGMTDFLNEGYVDTFRELYPDKDKAYTFWTYMSNARTRNVGWRLDYFIVSKRFMDNVCDNLIHSSVVGSDHCPISLHINI